MPRNSMIAQHERDARIARAVMARLRAEGLLVTWNDVRTPNGMRLDAINLRCAGVAILCRPVGYRLAHRDRVAMRANDPCYVQWGATDCDRLIRYLRGLSTVRNPFDMPKC